jgi:ATP-dependent helicase HrpB
VKLGEEVGYQIRFDDVTSRATRIRYVTEGVLLRQMLSDENCAASARFIFDEFHERHLYGDITLARALQIQESARPDLIIVVMSATLDVGPLAEVSGTLRIALVAGPHVSGRDRLPPQTRG